MIPIHLSLSGFLSYREPVAIDFSTFDLACISGANGAGKSSLLDAITWALFGQARRRDDALINNQSEIAEVIFTFDYESNQYRVQRSKARGKSTVLEFLILQTSSAQPESNENWKPLTERTIRDTQAKIESTLRLDYETFVNAAFFLQGKADQFTQQRPSDRKRILGSILGLEIWEQYRARAGTRRRAIEAEIENLEGRLHEIEGELAEEDERVKHLAGLERELERLSQARTASETSLENMRKIAATLAEQRKLVATLARQLDSGTQTLHNLEIRLEARQKERQIYAQTLDRETVIEKAYHDWIEHRTDLARWDEIAVRFREHESRRGEPLREIETARAVLASELKSLQEKKASLDTACAEIPDLEERQAAVRELTAAAQGQLDRRAEFERQLGAARDKKAAAAAENPRLKSEMEELKDRIDQLSETEGATCPLCGEPLSPEDRQRLIDTLSVAGADMGDRYRANKTLLQESDQHVQELEAQIATLTETEVVLRTHLRETDQIAAQLAGLQKSVTDWEATDAPQLEEIQRELVEEIFAPQARASLAEIDAELKAIGYDAAAHDAIRRAEKEGRTSEEAYRQLEAARAVLEPITREVQEIESQIKGQKVEVARQQEEHDGAATTLAEAEAQAPDLESAERDLYQMQEEENQLRMEVGAARQKVLVLDDLKTRQEALTATRADLTLQVSQYKQLERAFGKDGVPALLIEQALPQIETKANEILERLSAGTMSVRFITQAAYKDKRRDDLKETLDIQISDGAGARDYELYSGGEAFRVNFAIRLALSEVLAQRAGARLQTLVIDEGFGSQDALGRQRLIEAINLVRPDFAKILVITHIDELKDAFPSRIEVEKTEAGSVVEVV